MNKKIIFLFIFLVWICVFVFWLIWFIKKVNMESRDAEQFCNFIDGEFSKKVFIRVGYYCNGEKIVRYVSSVNSENVLWGFLKDGSPFPLEIGET